MATEITITLEVDPGDADPGHDTGLTNEAFERLFDALSSEGYSVVSGPTRVSK